MVSSRRVAAFALPVALGSAALSAASSAPAVPVQSSGEMSFEAFVEMLRRALTENPAIFQSAVEAWQEWQRITREQNIIGAFVSSFDEVFRNENVPLIGRRDAKIVIAEFYDFNCPFCRQIQSSIDAIKSTFKDDVAIAMHGFPILSPISELAERVAYQVWRLRPDRYGDVVRAFYVEGAAASEEAVRDAFERLNVGLTWSQVSSGPGFDAAGAIIAWRRQFAQSAMIQGTPFLAIARVDVAVAAPADRARFIRIVPGVVPLEQIERTIRDLLAL